MTDRPTLIMYMLVDMEGISGVYRDEQVQYGTAAWAEARAYMEADVNACARGLFAGGATGVLVRDVHGMTCNLRWDKLDPRVELISGDAPNLQRLPGLCGQRGVVLLGYHAMAGTARAVLEHTSHPSWQRCWINDMEVGELAFDAACAGEEGVPVVLVSGDAAACAEARRLLPGVGIAEVKEGLGRQCARLLPQPAAHHLLEACGRAACKAIKERAPYRVSLPVRIRVELAEGWPLPNAVGRPCVRILDGRTFEVSGDTFTEARARLLA